MPQITVVLILLPIISLTVHTVKSSSHVIVTPTDSDPSICGDHAVCDTLANLISNNTDVLSSASNLEFEFLKGIHTVAVSKSKLLIEEITAVYWYGNDAVIICKTDFGFVFSDINKLEIKQLTFSNCGTTLDGASNGLRNVSAALFLNNVQSFYSEKVQVNLSSGYGLLVYNLHGEAHIKECLFQDNNVNCSRKNSLLTQSSHDQCVGGNIALHFYTRAGALNASVQVYITDSIIQGGSDLSETVSSCEDRMENPSSSSAFKANGLAVVFAQEDYQVRLHICGTTFFNNTGNMKHPAVLVHDYSFRSNIFEINDSSFINESTLYGSIIKNDEKDDNSVTLTNDTVWLLRNCSFRRTVTRSRGSGVWLQGIYICIKPAKVMDAHFQKIEIVNCNFYAQCYSYIYTDFIRILYNFPSNNTFPSTLVEMDRCTMVFDCPYFVTVNFTHDQFLDYNKPEANFTSILIIKHSNFYTTKKWLPVSEIFGPRDSTNLWKYQKRNITLAGFFNSTFTSPVKVTNATIVLRDCNFTNSRRTAIRGVNSVIVVDGQNFLRDNRGYDGGALSLHKSILLLMPNSQTIISGNSATYGGGIYATPIEPDKNKAGIGIYSFCTLTRLTSNRYLKHSITFKENQAVYSGHSIYGGKYSNCTYNCTGKSQCQNIPDNSRFDYEHLHKYISIIPYSNDSKFTEVSSPANRICLCGKNKPTNYCSHVNLTLFPGQVLNISLIALGELNGSTTVVVTTYGEMKNVGGNHRLFVFPADSCTFVGYKVLYGTNSERIFQVSEHFFISAETPQIAKSSYPSHYPSSFEIKVSLSSSCPPGLILSPSSQRCECLTLFERLDIKCDEFNAAIQIRDKQWIGHYNYNYSKLVVADKYPPHYLTLGKRYIDFNKTEEQCINNRSGVLCGACRTNLSMVLGTSNCKKCSNVYLLLIIPFALAGVALVVLLLKCNLTVSVGHINGIIFYANIVQVNKVHLFQNDQNTAYHIFSTFIAWLNLDLGIETCFFENMDSYAKVWLQFVFPVYMWTLIGLIIMLAKYSIKLSRLIADNSVPVLATLLLLSYTKLFRTVMECVAYTYLQLENEPHIVVWQKEGNVEYFGSKHFPLFIVALVFLFLYILPLSLLVLLTPCFQALSHHKTFRWVNRLKPFLDAYQGPYSDKFRIWTGLLLMVRVPLFIVYTVNYRNDPGISHFCTIAATSIATFTILKNATYKRKITNWMKTFSLLNLVTLCSVNWLSSKIDYKELQSIGGFSTYASVALMMLVFIGIILYQLCSTFPIKRIFASSKISQIQQPVNQASRELKVSNAPTSSEVELKDCDQLREPLLDSD